MEQKLGGKERKLLKIKLLRKYVLKGTKYNFVPALEALRNDVCLAYYYLRSSRRIINGNTH